MSSKLCSPSDRFSTHNTACCRAWRSECFPKAWYKPRGLAGRGFLAALHARLTAQLREGKLPVSFEVVYGHAWRAPARRGPKQTEDGRAIVQFERRR